MDLGIRGKVAIVTGASRGIGRAIALRLAEEGAGIAVCDVGDAEALDRFLDPARDSLGRVDILVNNPSGFAFADDEAAWQSSLNLDLMAAVRASWKVSPSRRCPSRRPTARPRRSRARSSSRAASDHSRGADGDPGRGGRRRCLPGVCAGELGDRRR